jgi:hypothetical protein
MGYLTISALEQSGQSLTDVNLTTNSGVNMFKIAQSAKQTTSALAKIVKNEVAHMVTEPTAKALSELTASNVAAKGLTPVELAARTAQNVNAASSLAGEFHQNRTKVMGKHDANGRPAPISQANPLPAQDAKRPPTSLLGKLIGRNVTAEASLQIPGKAPVVLEVKPGRLSDEQEKRFTELTDKYIADHGLGTNPTLSGPEFTEYQNLQAQRLYNGGSEYVRANLQDMPAKTFIAIPAGSGHDLEDAANLAKAISQNDDIATISVPTGGWSDNARRHLNGGPLLNTGTGNAAFAQGVAAELAKNKNIKVYCVPFSQGADAARHAQAALNPEQRAMLEAVHFSTMGGSAAQIPNHIQINSTIDLVPKLQNLRVFDTHKSGQVTEITCDNPHDGGEYAKVLREKVLGLTAQKNDVA